MKASEAEDFFHGARKEIDDWSPKSWPQLAKVPSPILAPPVEGGVDRDSEPADVKVAVKAGAKDGKAVAAKAPVKKK